MAANTWLDVTCPSGCSASLNYVAIPTDPSCTLPPPLSEISDIYIQPTGATAPFAWGDPDNPTAVSGAIDNSITDNTKSKHFKIVGSQGDPEETFYEGPDGTRTVIKRRYTTTGRTPITDQSYYDFFKQLQCNYTNFVFWFGTRGGYLFGGQNGITPQETNARFPKVEGEEGAEEAVSLFIYDTLNGDPPRTPNPLA